MSESDDWLYAGNPDPEDVLQHYEDWAESYDDDVRKWSYRAPEVVASILLGSGSDLHDVLDAGCGTGLSGAALRAAGYTGELHGIDLSPASLRRARAGGSYTSVREGNLQRPLELADDSTDGLVCVGVLTYVPDTEAIFREFIRVVRPGGVIVLTQREDVWEDRGCQALIDGLAAEGLWTPLEVRGPEPYLPQNPDGIAPVGVYYVAARVAPGT